MSKIIDKLLPEDFGKSFDMEVFNAWKKSVSEHQQTGIPSMILYIVGLALLWLLGGLVGLVIFFTMSFIGIGITMPKKKKVQQYQTQLGINNQYIKNAIAVAKKRN